MKGWASALVFVAMVGIGQPALANDVAAAKKLFAAGEAAYAIGHYLDAASNFENAFLKSPRPAFLWNAASAYRKQYELDGEILRLKKARNLYRNLLQIAEDGKLRADAERELAGVEAIIASTGQPVARPELTTSKTSAPPPESDTTPVYKKWWLWTAVSVAVAGVVTGLAVGLTRPGGAPDTPGGNYPSPKFQ